MHTCVWVGVGGGETEEEEETKKKKEDNEGLLSLSKMIHLTCILNVKNGSINPDVPLLLLIITSILFEQIM